MEFKEVSKNQFFDVIGPLDVHPRVERDKTYWETRERHLVGITRGYASDETPFFLLRDSA